MSSPAYYDWSMTEFLNSDQNSVPELNIDDVEQLVNFDSSTATDMTDFFVHLTGEMETSSQNQGPQDSPAQDAAWLEDGLNLGPSDDAGLDSAFDEAFAEMFGEDSTNGDLQQDVSKDQTPTSPQDSSPLPTDIDTQPQVGLVPASGLESPLPSQTIDPTNLTRQGNMQEASATLSADMAQLDLMPGPDVDLEAFLDMPSNPVEPTTQGIGLGSIMHYDQAATEELQIDTTLFDLTMETPQQPVNPSGMTMPTPAPAWKQDNSAATMDLALAWEQDNQVVMPTGRAPAWRQANSQVAMSTSTSPAPAWGQANSQVDMSTSTSPAPAWGQDNSAATMDLALAWGQANSQVAMSTSSASAWGHDNSAATMDLELAWEQDNQMVMPTSQALAWGQDNSQVVVSTSPAPTWRQDNSAATMDLELAWEQDNQVVMPTNPAPAWGQPKKVGPKKYLLMEMGDTSAIYQPLEGRPKTWGPSKHPKLFSYTEHGEWSPSDLFDKLDLMWYITNARRLANRPLKIWIQTPPSQRLYRYPNDFSAKCRWSECPVGKNTILNGFYRVAFDERPDQSGTVTNPFHNAGYMHLHCFEKIFDLFELIHCGIAAIDDRVFPHESCNIMSVLRDHPNLFQVYNNWCRVHAAAYLAFDNFRNKTKKRTRHIPNEQKLWSVLTRMSVELDTTARWKTRADPDRNTIDKHLGDLDAYLRCVEKRVKMNKQTKKRMATEELSTTDADSPRAKRARRDSATMETPSPAMSHITVRGYESEEDEDEEERNAASDAQAPEKTPPSSAKSGSNKPWDAELRGTGGAVPRMPNLRRSQRFLPTRRGP